MLELSCALIGDMLWRLAGAFPRNWTVLLGSATLAMLIAPLAVGLDKSDGDRDCDVALAKTPGGHSAIFIHISLSPTLSEIGFWTWGAHSLKKDRCAVRNKWCLKGMVWGLNVLLAHWRCRLFVEDLGASLTKKQANNAGGYGSGTTLCPWKNAFFCHVTKGHQLWRHDPSTLRSADDIDVTGRTSRMHSGGGVRCPRGFRFTAKQIDPNGRYGFSSRRQIDSYLLEIEVGNSKFYGYWVRAFHYFFFKDELLDARQSWSAFAEALTFILPFHALTCTRIHGQIVYLGYPIQLSCFAIVSFHSVGVGFSKERPSADAYNRRTKRRSD